MQSKTYKEDRGKDFGKWTDKISKFLYYESTKEILSKIKIPLNVADYGGANGLLKKIIPNSISIDLDHAKKPDILDNIITHKNKYDLVIIRYVLHYLNDYEIIELFKNINAKNILVIQFVNNDLKAKYYNSQNEFKYFRTSKQLKKLMPKSFKKIYSKKYYLDSEFYTNRLGTGKYKKHQEILNAYYK